MTKQMHRSRVTFTLVDAVQTKKVKRLEDVWLSWAHTIAYSTEPFIAESKAERDNAAVYPLISGAVMRTFEEGGVSQGWMLSNGDEAYSRRDSNIDRIESLILDFDNDPKKVSTPVTLDQIKARLDGLEFVYWTSYSHRSDKYGDTSLDMFRVVLPLLNPVSVDEYKERTDALVELFPEADLALKRPSQPYYLPVVHPALREHYQAGWNDTGDWFDFLTLPINVREQREHVPTVATDEIVKSAEEITIRLANGRSLSAADLYDNMREGEKATTYRIGDSGDRKPGAFLYRNAAGLSCYNEDGSKNRWIQCRKVVREEPSDALVLVKREAKTTPKIVAPAAPVEPVEPVERITLNDLQRSETWQAFELSDNETVMTLNERFLPDMLNDQFPDEGVFVIQSPKGTGKTERLKTLVQDCNRDDRSVMLLGHRVFLLNNLSIRTNLDFYRDLDNGKLTNQVSVCLNSLASRMDPHRDRPYDTIIIDESEQVLQALVAKILEKDLSKVFNTLIWLFQNAKRIICLDADLSAKLTIGLVTMMRGIKEDDDCRGVINTYLIGEGKTTKQYFDKYHLMHDAISDLDAGEKLFIATNTKTLAKKLHAVVESLGKRVLLVSADTAEGEDQQAFIENPEVEAPKYDAVITTPTLSTGVSIDGSHFTRVYGIFGLNPGTFQDADQAISRVRSCDNVSVWLQPNIQDPVIPSEETIRDSAIRKELGERKVMPYEQKALTDGEELWARIYGRILRMVKLWSCNKGVQFREMRQALGFTVETIMPSAKKSEEMKALLELIEVAPSTYANDIWNSEPLDGHEFDELSRKKHLSREERLRVDRHKYAFSLGELFSLEALTRAIEQKFNAQFALMKSLITASHDTRTQRSIDDRQFNKNTFTINKNPVMSNALLVHLCKSAKIDIVSLYQNAGASARGEKVPEIEITHSTLKAVAKAFEERVDDFNLYFNLRITDPKSEQNLKTIWDGTFGKVALPLKKRKLKNADGEREARYFINWEKADVALQRIDELKLARDLA